MPTRLVHGRWRAARLGCFVYTRSCRYTRHFLYFDVLPCLQVLFAFSVPITGLLLHSTTMAGTHGTKADGKPSVVDKAKAGVKETVHKAECAVGGNKARTELCAQVP